MIDCLIEWLRLSEIWNFFETFEWEGIKWLSPLLLISNSSNSNHGEKMTWLLQIKDLKKMDLKTSEIFFWNPFQSLDGFKCPGQIWKYERRNITLQTRGNFVKYLNHKTPGVIWKIFAKRNKINLGFFWKNIFFKVFILAVEKCSSYCI